MHAPNDELRNDKILYTLVKPLPVFKDLKRELAQDKETRKATIEARRLAKKQEAERRKAARDAAKEAKEHGREVPADVQAVTDHHDKTTFRFYVENLCNSVKQSELRFGALKVSDEYREDWDLSGAVEDAKLLFHVGLQAANQSSLPAWNPGVPLSITNAVIPRLSKRSPVLARTTAKWPEIPWVIQFFAPLIIK